MSELRDEQMDMDVVSNITRPHDETPLIELRGVTKTCLLYTSPSPRD